MQVLSVSIRRKHAFILRNLCCDAQFDLRIIGNDQLAPRGSGKAAAELWVSGDLLHVCGVTAHPSAPCGDLSVFGVEPSRSGMDHLREWD